ncbi:Uncharacterized protein LSUE1_G006945 [Lachnellula suecica]|uniref:MOSC domain-containing protein n=1 Tax=Lachnellula suecica TaxID=602035 RepID=A0A8T9CEW3_9HELO|nr:Uncharacterized protein LSUE1_G006945 [Lachnellula suecica]
MKITEVLSPSATSPPRTNKFQLHIYPIKSLRGIPLPTASLNAQGIAYDRRYILLKPAKNGGWINMFVGVSPEMALFHCDASSPGISFTVSYHTPSPPVAPPTLAQNSTLEIPFEPNCAELEKLNIEIYTAPAYPAYRMQDSINTWFSDCFGYEVILAYLGDSLGVKKSDDTARKWISSIKPSIPRSLLKEVSFSDGAALLVASEASLQELHPRLGNGEKAALEKFRPNIVVDGLVAWDEDFWAELILPRTGARILLTANCARCSSINVDLQKGKMGNGESGKLLKKMMRDRRVDAGSKWSPVFGRYGFPVAETDIRIGDEVVVNRRNREHTVWSGFCHLSANFSANFC